MCMLFWLDPEDQREGTTSGLGRTDADASSFLLKGT